MKKSLLFLIPIPILFLIFLSFTINLNTKTKKIIDTKDLILVELFTSQGCSSCPPADDLLAKTIKKNINIIAISYPVDYWNRLGWKDPFSSEKFTKRQNEYRNYFKSSTLYTPQMVVNGQTEFVGSNASKLKDAISSSTALQSSIFTKVTTTKDQILIHTTLENTIKNSDLITVLIAKTATTFVKRGENEGKNLRYTNVALSYQVTASKDAMNPIYIKYPKDYSKNNLQIISFLQNYSTKKIEAISVSNL
jgi:hypothetical protein